MRRKVVYQCMAYVRRKVNPKCGDKMDKIGSISPSPAIYRNSAEVAKFPCQDPIPRLRRKGLE